MNTVETPAPAMVYIPQPNMPRCTDCDGVARVVLDVGHTGYSVTSTHAHTSTCKHTICPHGVPWRLGCADCDVDFEARADGMEFV